MFAVAGGAPASGAHHTGFIFGSVPEAEWKQHGSAEAFIAANPLPIGGLRRVMTMTDWLKTTSAAVNTREHGLVRVSREAVLKYAANRKGGVHFDPSRSISASASSGRQRRQLEQLVLDLDILRVGHLWSYEYEVASMVHDVSRSDWAQELARLAHEAAPQDFESDPNALKFFSGDASDGDGTGWATMRFPGP